VDGHFIDVYTNPIWPDFKVLRSNEGTVIGIVNADSPNRILALYDIANGEHWAGNFDEANKRGVGESLLNKLKTSAAERSKLHL
jgi:hypothetical protein